MTGNFAVDDRDITDLCTALNELIKKAGGGKVDYPYLRRLEDLKDRLLKVDVNEY